MIKNKNKNKNEEAYLDLLRELVSLSREANDNHHPHRPDRTGTGTISVFARQLRFDLVQGKTPFLTTKTLAWKTVLRELLWFFKGKPDVRLLEKNNVRIWSANASREFLDERGLKNYEEGDVGPLYPFSFRHFGANYQGCDKDYTDQGLDQLQKLIQGLEKEPYSRRHVMTTFDPAVVDDCALPPCHGISIQFYLSHLTHGLSCHVVCRSSDVFLGLPFNIASYGFFVHIVAKKLSKTFPDIFADELVVSTGDTHLYLNHIHQAEQQISRCPFDPPTLLIKDDVIDLPWESIGEEHFEIIDYIRHPPLLAAMAI